MIKFILTTISICTLTFCFQYCSDYNEELSGNYFYRDEGEYSKEIVCHSAGANKGIFGKVISFDYNSNFIIAAQIPSFDDYEAWIQFHYFYDSDYKDSIEKNEIQMSYHQKGTLYDKLFSHEINFWIISHEDKQIFGPLTLDEYLRKRRELNVPESLEVKLSL
jgi:hypothetical protein